MPHKVAETTLNKITQVKKPVTKFVIHICSRGWDKCGYVFSKIERSGEEDWEKYYRCSKKSMISGGSIIPASIVKRNAAISNFSLC